MTFAPTAVDTIHFAQTLSRRLKMARQLVIDEGEVRNARCHGAEYLSIQWEHG